MDTLAPFLAALQMLKREIELLERKVFRLRQARQAAAAAAAGDDPAATWADDGDDELLDGEGDTVGDQLRHRLRAHLPLPRNGNAAMKRDRCGAVVAGLVRLVRSAANISTVQRRLPLQGLQEMNPHGQHVASVHLLCRLCLSA